MLEVEGAGEAECMRILRHEAGHAFSNAFRLHARRALIRPDPDAALRMEL